MSAAEVHRPTSRSPLASKRLMLAAMIMTMLAVVLHSYLAYHFYLLKYALVSKSICTINSKFNCNAVAASRYATFIGIPVALWGALTNFVLVLFTYAGFSFRDSVLVKRLSLWLACFIALMSLIMGTISFTRMDTYCVFCMSLYVISFIDLALIWLAQMEKVGFKDFLEDVGGLLSTNKGAMTFIVCIPLAAWLLNSMALAKFHGHIMSEIVDQSLVSWQSNPVQHFGLKGKPYLQMGPENAAIQIVEFADFRCPHCREAAPVLHAWMLAHPDVHFVFQSFPLDGTCNPGLPNGDGISCFLAKAVYCSIPSGHGWDLNREIFDKQEKFMTSDEATSETKKLATKLGINWGQLSQCINADQTQQEIMNQAERGNHAGVQGTPTLYLNGRQLPSGQLLPVLDAAYALAKRRS